MSGTTLIIDNYDSFTYNLVQYLGELGAEIESSATTPKRPTSCSRGPARVIVSPGPCTPAEAGVSVEAIRRFAEAGTPVLGVCMGQQCLAVAFGGAVVRGDPVHGKTAQVEHDGRTIFTGLESPFEAGRYHSLVVDPDLPDCLERSAWSGETLMGMRHRELPAEGVQFHPESVLTGEGKRMLATSWRADGPEVEPGHAGRLRPRRARAPSTRRSDGRRTPAPDDDVVFFQANCMVVALWSRERLAEDSVVEDSGGWGGITLAYNTRSPAEVDSVIEEARAAGGAVAREPGRDVLGRLLGDLLRPRRPPVGGRAQPSLGDRRRRRRQI